MGCGGSSGSIWSPPLPFDGDIDAILWNGVKAGSRADYMFKGNKVLVYNCDRQALSFGPSRLKEGPVEIEQQDILKELPPPFNTKIDAAGIPKVAALKEAFIFSGNQVVEYYMEKKALTGGFGINSRLKAGPMPIAQHDILKELPPPFCHKIDAVIMPGKGATMASYFFSGDQVVEYYLEPQILSGGFGINSRLKAGPVSIKRHEIFQELPPPFCEKIDTVVMHVTEGNRQVSFFSGGQVVEYYISEKALTGGYGIKTRLKPVES